MNMSELTEDEIQAVAGGLPPLLAAFAVGWAAGKVSSALAAAAFGAGAAAAIAALSNDS